MTDNFEYEVEQIFAVGRRIFKVVESEDNPYNRCMDCVLLNFCHGHGMASNNIMHFFGPCDAVARRDKKDIYFEELRYL